MPPRRCPVCSTTIPPNSTGGTGKKYCSWQCRDKANKKGLKPTCSMCEKPFERAAPNQRYCKPCQEKRKELLYSGNPPCRYCRAPVTTGGKKKDHYCSPECTQANWPPERERPTCPICDTTIEPRTVKDPQKYCSQNCRSTAYYKRTGTPTAKRPKVKVKCFYEKCDHHTGSGFQANAHAHEIENNLTFCNAFCRGEHLLAHPKADRCQECKAKVPLPERQSTKQEFVPHFIPKRCERCQST